MNPRDFEVAIARQLQAEGYATEITGSPGDWGVDIIALRGAERLAVQVKMYGGTTRPVNRRMVFELFGAAAYFDCSGSVIATDGRIMADAAAAAEKLGMRILRPGPSPDAAVLGPVDARQLSGSPPPTASRSVLDFETIWAGSIAPLVGRTLTRADLSSNVVVQVDWAGVTRITSNGRRQHIPIEVFRWAIDRVLRTGRVTIRDAAKEAVKFADLLVVCGFAFDPLAGEEASTLGRLTILQARMNPDLAMGDELLKKTGSGNLFMVFGEPDIDVRPSGDGLISVEVRGLDVYDPTTGVLRSSSVDDIAAWFLDTNYDGDAFFVRHAYFTGADDPYEKLRRALRADISDEAWASVNSTVSRPFPRPKTGKVAVKVINHYGDEVMKVFGA